MMSFPSPKRLIIPLISLLLCSALAACGSAGESSPTAVSPESLSRDSVATDVSSKAADASVTSATPSLKDVAGDSAEGALRTVVVYEGPITGVGSVIVNNVHFDDSGATVRDESGATMSRADLKLGAYVRIEGSIASDANGTNGVARNIIVLPTLRGRIETIDSSTGTLTVLSQTVLADSATVYEGASVAAPLQVGDYVEVHGIAGNQTVLATLIERKNPATFVATIRGVIRHYSEWGHFRIGPLLIKYGNAQVIPDAQSLADGVFVTVRAQRAPEGDWLFADTILTRGRATAMQGTADVLEFMGIVESEADSEGRFKVSGVKVLPVSTDSLPKGGFLLGQRVSVGGAFVDQVFHARHVTIETPGPTPGGQINRAPGTAANRVSKTSSVNGTAAVSAGSIIISPRFAYEATASEGQTRQLHGAVRGFVSQGHFNLNGLPIDASRAQFRQGEAGTLADDQQVEVIGVLRNGTLVASEVEFKRPGAANLPRQSANIIDPGQNR